MSILITRRPRGSWIGDSLTISANLKGERGPFQSSTWELSIVQSSELRSEDHQAIVKNVLSALGSCQKDEVGHS